MAAHPPADARLIEVPIAVVVGLVRKIWLREGGLALTTLLDGGRERFVQCMCEAARIPWPEELRRPTPEEFGEVFDRLIQEGAS